MLKKKNRLPASCFKTKYSEHKRNRLFSVKIKPNGLSLSRFGIVITKTIEKSAVGRNRLRRTIYRVIQEKKLDLAIGQDVIIFAQPAALGADINSDAHGGRSSDREARRKKNIAFALNELLA